MKIEAVIFDWAGTTVDFGCFAPVKAFQKAFEKMGLNPTLEETREPMGLPKREHIATMLKMERLNKEFKDIKGREFKDSDVDIIYENFVPTLFETLENYADILDGVVEVTEKLNEMNIKIGSTTGYTSDMMSIIMPIAKQNGYNPKSMVCPDDTNEVGRPYPYMIWKNLQNLDVKDISNVIKVGDTVADIKEGKNAGCISVGVLIGSSMMGLSKEEVQAMSEKELDAAKNIAKSKYLNEGADYVIHSITDLISLIEGLEEK